MKKQLKIAAVAVLLAVGFTASAQQETGDVGRRDANDLSKARLLDGTIRVIDNKGTKKFLQVKNGLTLLTDQTASGGIISTWQLGGTLTNNTYIDAENNIFALDGLKLIDATQTDAGNNPAGSATTLSKGKGSTTESGYVFLVRDEGTGETKKLLPSDLVKSGHIKADVTTDGTAPTLSDVSIPANYSKVSVYRNGAKLIANLDYTVVAGAVTLVPQSTAGNDWELYAGDVIEVQWIN